MTKEALAKSRYIDDMIRVLEEYYPKGLRSLGI